MSLSVSHSVCTWCGSADAPYRLPAEYGDGNARFCSHECVQQVHAALISAAKKRLQLKKKRKKQQTDPSSDADVWAQYCLFDRNDTATIVDDQEVVNEWINKSSVVARSKRTDPGSVRRLTYNNQIALEMILTQFAHGTQNTTPCVSAVNAIQSYVRVSSAGADAAAAKFNWSVLNETAKETEMRIGTLTTLVLTPPNVVSHFASTAELVSVLTSSPDLADKPEVFRMALAAGSRTLGGFTRRVPGGDFVIRASVHLFSPKVDFLFVGKFPRFPSFPRSGGKNRRVLLVVPGTTVAVDVGQNQLEALTGLLVLTLEKNAIHPNQPNVRTIDVVIPSRIPRVQLT